MNPQTDISSERVHRELYNRSRDIIAVKNILPRDYRLVFDMRVYIVPSKDRSIGYGNGIAQLSRYLAEKYRREMVILLLQEKAMDLVRKENARRADAGNPALNKWEEQQIVESQVNVNGEQEQIDCSKQIWLGLVQKAPDDLLLMETSNQDSTKTAEDRINEQLQNVVYTPETTHQAPPQQQPSPEALAETFITTIQNNET